MVCEGIELLDATEFTRPGFDAFVGVAGFAVVGEVEADEGEVAAAEADGGWLTRGGGRGAEGAERDDGVGDP